MELRHLRYFVALAEHLSFTRAAEQVHVTQSTLSHQIKQLETEVGCRLFHRIGKRVLITESGARLLPRFKQALCNIDSGLRDAHENARQLSGTLNVGVTHTFNISLIPGCVAALLQKHRSVRVTIHELSADMIGKGIEQGEFDLGITYRPRNCGPLTFEPLCHDEMALVVPPQHPFASRKRVRMSELHRQELILYTKSSNTREFLDGWFKSAGAEPVVVLEMNACAPMPGYVRKLGIPGVMSRLGTADLGDLKIVPIESPTPLRTTGILWGEGETRSGVAQSFAAIVRHAVLDLTTEQTRRAPAGEEKEKPAGVLELRRAIKMPGGGTSAPIPLTSPRGSRRIRIPARG